MLQTLKDNKSALTVTYGTMFLEGALTVIMIATMSLLQSHFNRTASEISFFITAKSIGTILTIYGAGTLSDRWGRKHILLAGITLFIVFLLGISFTGSFYGALFFSLVGGVAHGLMDAPALSMLVDIFGEKSGPAMSFVQVFFATGSIVTTYLASLLIQWNMQWNVLYLLFVVFSIVLMIVCMYAKYPTSIVLNKTPSRFNRQPSFKREGVFLSVLLFLMAMAVAIINTWLPNYAHIVKSVDIVMSVQYLSLMQMGNIVGALLFAYILTKFHATQILVANSFIAFSCIIVLIMGIQIHSTSIFILGMVTGVLYSLALNIIGNLFPDRAGKATGFMGLANMMAIMTGTFVSGALYPVIGFQNVFIVALGLFGVAIMLSIVFRIMYRKLVS